MKTTERRFTISITEKLPGQKPTSCTTASLGRLWSVQHFTICAATRMLGSKEAPCHSWTRSTFLIESGQVYSKLKNSTQALTATFIRMLFLRTLQHLTCSATPTLFPCQLPTERQASSCEVFRSRSDKHQKPYCRGLAPGDRLDDLIGFFCPCL